MITLNVFLLHALAFPGSKTTAKRLADINNLAAELETLQTPPAPPVVETDKIRADVDAMLATLKNDDPAEFERVRKLPFSEQAALGKG